MTDNVENLSLQHLKAFRARFDRIDTTLGKLVVRVGSLEVAVAGIRLDLALTDERAALMSVRMDTIAARWERVERRLDHVIS